MHTNATSKIKLSKPSIDRLLSEAEHAQLHESILKELADKKSRGYEATSLSLEELKRFGLDTPTVVVSLNH